MASEEGSTSGFRVVDRRAFSADGSRKEEVLSEETGAETAPGPQPAPATEIPIEPGSPFENDSARFEMLVSYLSTTAMFQMGLIPGPSGERIPPDLPNARRTVDLIEVLQEKTRGNLTAQESRLLEDVLYELRMSFVEMQKRHARKSK